MFANSVPHRRLRDGHARVSNDGLRSPPETPLGPDSRRADSFPAEGRGPKMTKFAESSPPLARLMTVTPETIRAHIRKIIASRVLVRSERLARFLQFTVEETLAGHADQLKE